MDTVVTAAGGASRLVTAPPAGPGPADDRPVEIRTRRIRADEAMLLRALRLLALADAPWAFSGGLADEAAVPAQEWERRATDCATRDDDLVIFVTRFGTPSGLVRAYAPAAEPGRRELCAMWVAPWARGTGAADALVAEVVDWAGGVGADAVTLWVNEGNVGARRLYARHGFAVDGEPAGGELDGRRWQRMTLPLRAPGATSLLGAGEPGPDPRTRW